MPTSDDLSNSDAKSAAESIKYNSADVLGQVNAAKREVYDAFYLKVRRRVDLRIMPLVLLQYVVMRIDVQNITNVAIINLEQGTGIKKQLDLTAQQWVWVISSFYYPYMFLEPISTILLKKTSAPIWISRIMVSWGIITCCVALVKSYGGLIACRVLIGAAEAGYFPCYFWTFWYTPGELALRVAALYSASALSGFFGGFIAYAVSYANGALAGWQWLFIIEGIPPTIIGVATFFLLPSYPETSKWLSDAEKQAIADHLHKDAPKHSGHTWEWKSARLLFNDPTLYTFTAAWITSGVGGSGLSYALPTVINDLGFTDSKMSNVLTMPPSFAYFALVLILGYLVQGAVINPFATSMVLDLVLIVCYSVLLTVETVGVRYFVLIIATAASGCLYPLLWPKRVQAIRGTAMAGLAIGLHNASAQCSGLIGPQLFSTVYAPNYYTSYKVCIGLLAGAFTFHGLTWFLMHGPIEKYTPFLAGRVQAQTQLRSGDIDLD